MVGCQKWKGLGPKISSIVPLPKDNLRYTKFYDVYNVATFKQGKKVSSGIVVF